MVPRFVQFHALTSYPAALLNRDDAGFAKRIPFGGVSRTRISSQCLKRHWRTFQGENALSLLGMEMSVRSRLTFERLIYQPLVAEGVDEKLARAVTQGLMATLLGKSVKAEGQEKKKEKENDLHTGQLTILGRPEVDYLLQEARQICATNPEPKNIPDLLKKGISKDKVKNLQALGKASSGLDAALFGRMVTSDILSRGDAALHVAHAFTVHAEDTESDYFSAMDDLLQSDQERGSAHIGSTELTSGLYYTYVVVDVPLLVSNIEGCPQAEWRQADRTLSGKVLESLTHLISTVSPGAKLGSTAPYAYAQMVLVETGDAQPRTLANAFLRPVSKRGDLLENTYNSLQSHLVEMDEVYGRRTQRQVVGLGPIAQLRSQIGASDTTSLTGVGAWVSEQVSG